jgi:putative ABC transport system permease protein
MSDFTRNLLFSFRMLRRRLGFTAVMVLTLGLGIGANTAIFSVVDAVILNPLPYRNPEELMLVKGRIPKVTDDPIPLSAPDVIQFQRQSQTFESLAAFRGIKADFAGSGDPERIDAARVNANLFSLLGVHPMMGRDFTADDDQPGRLVAIASYKLWQSRFGGSRDIIGQAVRINRQPYEVIGVMPPSFTFPVSGMGQGGAADLFVPLAFTTEELAAVGDNFSYSVLGRLKPGMSQAAANQELEAIARRIVETYPAEIRADLDLSAVALPLHDQVIGESKQILLLLFGAVAFVLLISCINVASLLLTQATDRRKEIAVRLALGVKRGRLLGQFATESMMLTLIGAGVGLALAYWTTDLLMLLMPSNIPRIHPVELNLTVIGFTLGLAVLTGLIFSIVPALALSPTNLSSELNENARGSTQGRGPRRVLGALVVTEVALAMVLLIGAGLLLRSFQRVLETDPGFQPDHVLTASLSLPKSQYGNETQIRSFHQQLMQRLQQLPGAKVTGASTNLPLEVSSNDVFTPEGAEPSSGANLNICNSSIILGQYFQAMGVPLLQGRDFTEHDTKDSTPVVIVSQLIVKRYWKNQDAIGKRLKLGPPDSDSPWLTIVGIVGDVKQGPLDAETTPHVYRPYLQEPVRALNFVARSAGEPGSLAPALRAAIWGLDPQLVMAQVRTMEQVIKESTSPRRFNLFLLGAFAVLALALASIGIYGVISYSVARRSHEIGIRMALGAHPSDIITLILRQGLLLLGMGVAIGVGGALVLTRFLSSFLYGIRPADPVTFVGVVIILTGIGLLASYIPARRAVMVDPMSTLRSD